MSENLARPNSVPQQDFIIQQDVLSLEKPKITLSAEHTVPSSYFRPTPLTKSLRICALFLYMKMMNIT